MAEGVVEQDVERLGDARRADARRQRAGYGHRQIPGAALANSGPPPSVGVPAGELGEVEVARLAEIARACEREQVP